MKAATILAVLLLSVLGGCATRTTSSGSSGVSSSGDASGAGHYGSYGRISESPGPGSTGTSK